jgi:hypothetical protein
VSIRKKVFTLLDENPLLKPKELCERMRIGYKKHKGTVSNAKTKWRKECILGQTSQTPVFHRFSVEVALDRALSDRLWSKLHLERGVGVDVGYGWRISKNSNHNLIFKNDKGSAQWHATGTVIMIVRRPASLAKKKELFFDAFRDLDPDPVNLSNILPYADKILPVSVHAVYKTDKRLPRMTISDFKDSNGVVVKLGDESDPCGLEIIVSFNKPLHDALLEQTIAQKENNKLLKMMVENQVTVSEGQIELTKFLKKRFSVDGEVKAQTPPSESSSVGGSEYVR